MNMKKIMINGENAAEKATKELVGVNQGLMYLVEKQLYKHPCLFVCLSFFNTFLVAKQQ